MYKVVLNLFNVYSSVNNAFVKKNILYLEMLNGLFLPLLWRLLDELQVLVLRNLRSGVLALSVGSLINFLFFAEGVFG